MIFQEAASAIQVGGAVAVGLGLIEIIKLLLGKLTKNGSPSKGFTDDDRARLNNLWFWHAPDSSGMQSWKNWGAQEVREDFRRMIDLQQEMLRTLKRIEQQGKH